MFVNGRWSQNAAEVYNQMNARRGALIDAVYDDPELETLREEADLVMHNRFVEQKNAAVGLKKESMNMVAEAEQLVEDYFDGLTIDEIHDYEPKDR